MERTPEEIQAYLGIRNVNGYKALTSDIFGNYLNTRIEPKGDMPSVRNALKATQEHTRLDISEATYDRLELIRGVECVPVMLDIDGILESVGGARNEQMGKVITFRYSLLDPSGAIRRPSRGRQIPELGISTERYRQLTRGFFDRARYHTNLSSIVNYLNGLKTSQ